MTKIPGFLTEESQTKAAENRPDFMKSSINVRVENKFDKYAIISICVQGTVSEICIDSFLLSRGLKQLIKCVCISPAFGFQGALHCEHFRLFTLTSFCMSFLCVLCSKC